MNTLEQRDTEIRHGLGLFFHRELDRRYEEQYIEEIDDIRRQGLHEEIPRSHIEEIKDFFRRVLYPVGEERRYRDKAVETVSSIMGSAASILSLLPKMPGLLLRHGGRLPAISNAGLQVISGYSRAARLEEHVLESLVEIAEEEGISLTDGSPIPDSLYRRAYGSLDIEETKAMLEQTEQIVRLGMDRRLVAATIDIVEAVKTTRRDPDEQGALEYVDSILEEVYKLADQFSDQDVERIIRLTQIVEFHYFANLQNA